ncbi:MAG: CsbD family protein [Anaerolineae bacterium]|nr:CsbD family protein [Anaerolineae bacterium]
MNWDIIQGQWKQVKGHIQQQWGKLTDDELDMIEGSREKLAGKLQERYGWSREEADNQINEWASRQRFS